MTLAPDDQMECVATFLKSTPRYLRLGVEVEAAVRHLRAQAWEHLTKELKGLANDRGCTLRYERMYTGWTYPIRWTSGKDDSGSKTWFGVWVYRENRDSPDWSVGAENWPENAGGIKNSLLAAGREAVSAQDQGLWLESDCNAVATRAKVAWRFRGLPGDAADVARPIMALVSALVEVADCSSAESAPTAGG